MNKPFFHLLLLLLILLLSTEGKKPLHISLFTTDEEPAQLRFKTPESEAKIISFPDQSLVVTHDDKILFRYNETKNITTSDYTFVTEKDLKLESFENDIYYQDVSQWKLYAIEDFQFEKDGWSKEAVSSCGTSTNLFLGNKKDAIIYICEKSISKLREKYVGFHLWS